MSLSANSHIENLLGKQTASLLNAFEGIVDAYLLMDIKGRVLKMNTAAIELFGFDADDSYEVLSLIHPEEHERAMDMYAKLLEQGTLKDYKTKVVAENLDVKWAHINASLLYNDANEPIAIQGIVRDVTQEKENTLLIEKQARELDIVIDSSPLGIVLSNGSKIYKTNKAFQDLIGYSEKELEKLSIKDMSFPDNYEKSMKMLKKMSEGKVDSFSIEKRYLRKDQSVFWAKTTVSALKFDNSDDGLQVAMIENITSRREKDIIIKTINDVAKSILGKVSIEDIAKEIVNNVTTYLGTTDCVIYSVNQKTQLMEQVAAFGDKLDEEETIINKLTIKIGERIAGNVAKNGVAEIIKDTRKDKRYAVDGISGLSEICVPIIYEGEVIGIIDSEHHSLNYFSQKQLNTLKSIADLIAMKFKNGMDAQEIILAKKRLEESENRLVKLITNLDSGVLLEDENRTILLTNKKFCDLFNIPVAPELMIGQDCKDAAQQSKHLFKEPEEFVKLVDVITTKKTIVLGEELLMTDGKVLKLDYIPIFIDETYKGHLWTYKDITIRKNHEENLEVQRQKYSNVIENMDLGLIEVDLDGNVLMVNRSFEKMSGYSRDELLGKNPKDIFLTQESSHIIASKNQERLDGKTNSYELVAVTKNGEARCWLISGAPNYNNEGDIIGSIGIHLDITDLKVLEEQKELLLQKLEKNNQELQEYAHVVSHDLKSPLRNIAAITSWIREDYKDVIDVEGLNNFNLIDETLAKMEHLIEGVLNYSSIDKRPYVDKKVDLDTLVATMLNTIYIPNHITVNILKPLPELSADPIRMQQLFQNVLSNAVNYIDKEKGRVEIDYKENDTHFEFSITDNGIGIPKKYHKKIFNLFQTLETKKSTGIGLSIVKRIVEIHEGKIWVESELKKGTTFYFTLKK